MISAVEDAEQRRDRALDAFMRNITSKSVARIRIGAVTVKDKNHAPVNPCFRMIVENGRAIISSWHLIAAGNDRTFVYERAE